MKLHPSDFQKAACRLSVADQESQSRQQQGGTIASKRRHRFWQIGRGREREADIAALSRGALDIAGQRRRPYRFFRQQAFQPAHVPTARGLPPTLQGFEGCTGAVIDAV